MPVLELKTWPAGSAWSRGMGKPLCSLLEVECVLPLLRKLLQSSCSSRCLSTDRLSFSIQLSVEHTGSQTKLPQSEPGEGASQPGCHVDADEPTKCHAVMEFLWVFGTRTNWDSGIHFYWP